MKVACFFRGGVLGGVLAGAFLTCLGRLLGWGLPPWSASLVAEGFVARAAQWIAAAAVVLPLAIVGGIAVAFVCALVFEFVTQSARWYAGTIVGALIGAAAASIAGLVPWLASMFGYVYLPAAAPFGIHDPAWPFVALAVAGILMGAVTAAVYGRPLRARPVARTAWRQVYPPPSPS